eukprot:scaffold1288_cov286-Chaetoceros_neogracile.AAC.9
MLAMSRQTGMQVDRQADRRTIEKTITDEILALSSRFLGPGVLVRFNAPPGTPSTCIQTCYTHTYTFPTFH